jgi:hypothetical protein
MHTRRFTRLTNAFSKKVENHAHSVALFAMYYNFVRIHKTLRTTSAMAAGVTKRLWEISDIVNVLEAGSRQTRSKLPEPVEGIMVYWFAIAWVVLWSAIHLLGGLNKLGGFIAVPRPGQTGWAIVQITFGLIGTVSIIAMFFNQSFGRKLAIIFLVCLLIDSMAVFVSWVMPSLTGAAFASLLWTEMKQQQHLPPQSK